METSVQGLRVDKWLWAVRLYKSRSMASETCVAGKIHINGQVTKPSRLVKTGDVIMAETGEIVRTVKVLLFLDKRVGAKLVGQFLEDLTPVDLTRAKEKSVQPFVFRRKGKGRPTKKERRSIESFLQ